MPVAPSFTDLEDQFQAEALARRPDLSFLDGDITQAQMDGAAAMADVVLRYAVQAFKETFIDGARGDALTALVDDHLNLQRQPATPAQVELTFVRTSGGAATSIPAGTLVATEIDADGNEVRFTADTTTAVGLGNNGPFLVQATATELGRAGNAAAGTITRIISSLADPTFSVTNVDSAGGGNEQESDEQLRLRARNFFLTLRRGTLPSLEEGALTVPSVRVARATESPSGLVTVVVSDFDGNSTLQMVSDVETVLASQWRSGGTVLTVVGGTRLLVNIDVVLTVAPGVSVAALDADVEKSIRARMDKNRQGETLTLDSLVAAIIAVDPDGITKVTFNDPLADVVPTASQTIRTGSVAVA